ncbi:DUF3231 family protein [Natroniella sulfidigena]|uniref:DUF3231 family protein n=1 Tax=Natroniella sulfidigena TaxID=723921 RepID=UPI00200AC318|nr:DUF3231 family protein [Natroniella sulfidigena]MCK8818075.1 DUF3231 family protein [Natroniella sulfidigena]
MTIIFSFFRKDQKVSVLEAHALWNLLSSKYHAINNVQVWHAQVHDKDLKILIKDFLKDLEEHIKLLEKELEKYSIEAPQRPKSHAHIDANSQVISDETIGLNYFNFLQQIVDLILYSIQHSYYNDEVYTFLQRFSKHAIEQTDNILKYLKTKGWIDIPPNFLDVPLDTNEQLASIEAFNLWTHTNYRYVNIEETLRWKEFVHDADFKKILEKGLKKLNSQVKVLEKELKHFGLMVPKRPPKVVKTTNDKTTYKDEYIFKSLFIGLQWAGTLHSKAFQQCIVNDRIRKVFKDFLYEEMDMLNEISKYGKLKGWLPTPPKYTK